MKKKLNDKQPKGETGNSKVRVGKWSFQIPHWRRQVASPCAGLQPALSALRLPILLLILLAACNGGESSHQHDTYTCPMHPTVVSDRPGTCPVCGMDLVRKARPGESVEITEDIAKLLQSPNEAVVASISTLKGQYKSVPVTIQAQGMVTYDTRNIHTIPARVGGSKARSGRQE